MTYRHSAQSLIHIVIISSITTLAITDVKVNFRRIAARCCSAGMVGCCEETIRRRKPLNCSATLEDLVAMSDCVQKEMFGVKSLELARIEATLEDLVNMSDCVQKEMFGVRSLELARIEGEL
ncbi:hypothetical protein OESDEN_18151 [Oesophagostomum dentatum]|uniref:Uncharacterized protein n=1 Tax=Oesophagostomum dentatum TaxID=61180 RepID=A0A0B1SF82_OESDE|nr:hypothetical protein OESDEN_18151 [Oesophagostomum dentatum]